MYLFAPWLQELLVLKTKDSSTSSLRNLLNSSSSLLNHLFRFRFSLCLDSLLAVILHTTYIFRNNVCHSHVFLNYAQNEDGLRFPDHLPRTKGTFVEIIWKLFYADSLSCLEDSHHNIHRRLCHFAWDKTILWKRLRHTPLHDNVSHFLMFLQLSLFEYISLWWWSWRWVIRRQDTGWYPNVKKYKGTNQRTMGCQAWNLRSQNMQEQEEGKSIPFPSCISLHSLPLSQRHCKRQLTKTEMRFKTRDKTTAAADHQYHHD